MTKLRRKSDITNIVEQYKKANNICTVMTMCLISLASMSVFTLSQLIYIASIL